MFRIPTWWLHTRTPAEIKLALEYRLDHNDVARILHARPQQIMVWASKPQQRNLPLKSRQYPHKKARAYRVHDVREFAKQRHLPFDVREIPETLRLEWGIDIPDELA